MSTGMNKSKELKLIRLACKGDLDAATTLIRCHQSSVYSYIKRMCNRDDIAEDVTQEAFKRVLLNLDRFDPKYRFSTWVFTIARRVYLNVREKKNPTSDSDRLSTTASQNSDIYAPIEDAETNAKERDLLGRALLVLSCEQREIIILFHQHDWPIWLIADQLDIPEGTVKSHLFRGRVKLRDEYTRIKTAAEEHRRIALQRATARPVPVNARSSIFLAVGEHDSAPLPTSPASPHASSTASSTASSQPSAPPSPLPSRAPSPLSDSSIITPSYIQEVWS